MSMKRSWFIAAILATAVACVPEQNNGNGGNADPNNVNGSPNGAPNGGTNSAPSNNSGSNGSTNSAPVDDSCVDDDGDGSYVDCDDFTGVTGPDCDDSDADNWESCDLCADGDGDGYFASCDAYETHDGPDCDDEDPANWAACDTCVDNDGDGWVGECDTYDGLSGPDCEDGDANNWMSCAACVDDDGDGYFAGCDAYDTIDGPDCDDDDMNVNPGATEQKGNDTDDDCDPATPDDCSYVPVPANDPEPGVLAGVTAAHNLWRWRVGTPPLSWNSDLAASATAYAEECIWQHDADRSPDAGFSYVGENLYASTGQPSNALILNAVQSWADERLDYDFGTPTGQSGGAVVGHYTQVVWDDTEEVGCGYAYCDSIEGVSFSGTIVACRYGPGGNYNQQTPYDESTGACLDLDNDDVWQSADADDTDRSVQ
jgi:hypothetical protein